MRQSSFFYALLIVVDCLILACLKKCKVKD